MVGIFLTSGIFFLLLYFSLKRKTSLLWLSLYCFSHPIKTLFKPYQELVSSDFITSHQNHTTSQLIVVLGGFFLIGFILWELNLIKKKLWIFLYGVFCSLAYFFFSDRLFSDCLILLGVGLSAFGVYRRQEGSWWMLVGMLGYGVMNYLGHVDLLNFAYFVGIIFFIVCMLLSTAQKVRQEIKKQQQAMLRAATLENQLLKTTIQPHFVFNSLAALQELIEQNPSKASDFVEKLATEFDLITKASGKELIPILEEIELCRMHLSIMEYRKEGDYKLLVEGVDGSERIPPGIFHTLVENGITHGYSNKNKGIFKLAKTIDKNGITYSMFNDSDVLNDKANTVGTGLRYVQAAIEEHYGNSWSINWGPTEQGWKVDIKLNH